MASVGPFAPLGVVEEREHVAHAAFEGASERGEFGASGRTAFDGEGFDELGHHAPSLAPVLVRVTGDDLLVHAVLYCFNVCWAGSAVFFRSEKNQ